MDPTDESGAAGHGPLPAELRPPVPPRAIPRSPDKEEEEEAHVVKEDDARQDDDGDNDDDDDQHNEADADSAGTAANSKEESGGIEIGRFFRYKWLPSRRARQTTIQKMEMQQLQRRFEAREMADILRYRANASSRRRRRQRNAAAASSSSSSQSSDEGESGNISSSSSTSTSTSTSDDDNDSSSSSSSSSSSTASSRRARESRRKRKRRAGLDRGDEEEEGEKGNEKEEEEEEEEEEDEEGEQRTSSQRKKGRAVALSTRRRREPSGDGSDPKGHDVAKSAEAEEEAEEEKRKKKKKKKKDKEKKRKRRKDGEEADPAREKRPKRSRAVPSAFSTTSTTTKCAKCNTYNCLRACPKAMCSRCCPLEGEPCRAHTDRSRRASLNAKRTAERAGAAQRSRDDDNGAPDEHKKQNQKETEKEKEMALKVDHADAEAVAESTNEGESRGRPPGPTSSPRLKEEEVRRARRRQPSLAQPQQHRKCALCHANNYLRLCPKAMCRVCCPKEGAMCSPHALKESLKAAAPPATRPQLSVKQQLEAEAPLPADPFKEEPNTVEGLDEHHKSRNRTAAAAAATTATDSGSGGNEEREDRGKPSRDTSAPPGGLGEASPHGPDALHAITAEEGATPPATPSPSLSSSLSVPRPPTVVVTRAGEAGGRSEEVRTAPSTAVLPVPSSPSSSFNAASGRENDDDDDYAADGAGEEEEESSTHALAFFLKNAAAACSRSPASPALGTDALSPSSSLDSILAALPSAAPPYALDLDPSAPLGGVKRKHPTRCVQCNSNNALGACPKSCCSICCPKDGQRCPAHSHKRGSSASASSTSSTSSLRPPPAKRRNLTADAPQSPSEPSPYAFNDVSEAELLPLRRALRSDDTRQAPPPSAAAGVGSTHRTLKCVHCNSYNMLHSCSLQMCSICCHKSPRGPCPAHVRRSGEAPPADHAGAGAAPGHAPVGTPLSSPDLSSSDERKPKPRGRPKGSTKKKKLEDLARLMREHGEAESVPPSLLPAPSGAGAGAAEGGFQPFLYPAPSLPPPPLGRRAPARSLEASSRRAKQHTLARMRQQWLDDDDDDDDDDDEDVNVDGDDDDEDRINGLDALASDEDEDDDHDNPDDYDDDDDDEEEEEDGLVAEAKRENGASSSLPLPPKRKRGRPPKAKSSMATTTTSASPPAPPHDVVAMTLSTFRHASDLAADSGRAEEPRHPVAHEDDGEWAESGQGTRGDAAEAGRGRAAAAAAIAKAESSVDEEGRSARAWGDMPVEEVLVDDLLFLVCARDHRADFVRGMAEPTFLYAPKKGAAHYARRPKRQSIRSPSGASCSNCHKPKSTSWREGWVPRGSTSPIMLCHGCGTRYGKEMFCTYCHYIYMADEDWNTTKWIGCDSCTKWIHKKCEEIHVGRLIDVKAYYQCPTCRGEIIEPPPIGAPPVVHDETETLSD